MINMLKKIFVLLYLIVTIPFVYMFNLIITPFFKTIDEARLVYKLMMSKKRKFSR